MALDIDPQDLSELQSAERDARATLRRPHPQRHGVHARPGLLRRQVLDRLIEGGNAALVSMQAGHFVPIPFPQLFDPETGRTRVRLVDIRSTRYAIARRYMLRLRRDVSGHPAERC